MPDTILAENDGAVSILTMNRPDKLNALNRALIGDLFAALQVAEEDPDIAVVVLTGSGRAFCAGKDVKEFAPQSDIPEQAEASIRLFSVFSQMTKPVISAVNGYAVGGGCGLATSCDMAVAGESAVFGYPEVTRGAVPAFVMANLVRQVNRKVAFELLALGETIDARRALEIGLINRVVRNEDVVPEAVAIAQRMASFSRDAVRDIKQLFHQVADVPLPRALELARDAHIIMRDYEISTTV